MRALLLSEYGDPPRVALGDLDDPVPGPRQVLVRVDAAALNPVDDKLARGLMASVMRFDLPVALGWDVAGRVVEVGAGVTRYAVGQRVLGCLGPPTGTVAELVVADEEGPWLAPLRGDLPAPLAASLPMAGTTALTVVRALRREGTVLVLGAGGGLGAFLVPLLARAGNTVVATGSGEAAARLTAAGARTVLDHHVVDVAAATRALAPGGVDAVVDLVDQFDALQLTAELVRPGGQLLSTLFGPDPADFIRQDVEVGYVRNSPQDGDLEHVAALVADGAVVPVPLRPHAFGDAAAAFALLSGGRPGGKVVLDLTRGTGATDPTTLAIGVPA